MWFPRINKTVRILFLVSIPQLEIRLVLALFLLFVAIQSTGAQANSDRRATANAAVVTVAAPREEMMQGYLRWMHQHPEAVRRAQAPIPPPERELPKAPSERDADVVPLLILVPSIDLYSPSGISLYHGVDSDKNAAFIRALPHTIPRGNTAKTEEIRPRLDEAMEMFVELKPYGGAPLAEGHYTLFALTYADEARCKSQNEAIQGLKTRASQIGIRIIEVRLTK